MATKTRKTSFADVGAAAQESAARKPGDAIPLGGVTQPTPAPAPTAALGEEAAPERHPIYDSQDGEEPDMGHAHLMHDLGLAIQEMMQKDPATNKSMNDLMEEFMGKGVDYEAEGKRLKGLIAARKTPKTPNWVAAGVGSWAGGPEVREKFDRLREAATSGEAKKQTDTENVESKLLNEHVEDLRSRGKTKEALLLGLLQGSLAQKRTETTEQGKNQRAEDSANLRRELQDRALGAAEERVRLNIGSRTDVANKDRTAASVMHLYESLLHQTERDVTGAVKPVYTADEAMDMALNTVLPKVKAGVEAVKTGSKPKPAAGEATTEEKPKTGQSKFAQWKAQSAATPRK